MQAAIENKILDKLPLRIYIAGPMAKGDFGDNMRVATEAAHIIMERGHYPFIPHLFWYLNLYAKRSSEDWLRLDFVWLRQCEAIMRLPGESVGADTEVELAETLNFPVYHHMDEIHIVPVSKMGLLPVYAGKAK